MLEKAVKNQHLVYIAVLSPRRETTRRETEIIFIQKAAYQKQ
jgi:hypothetical protein